jgi:uncharacterized protein (TIGR01777 family)
MPNETFVYRSKIPASAEQLYAWHARPSAFQRLQPPWEPIDIVSQDGRFGDRLRITFRAHWLGPLRRTWIVEFSEFEPGRGFQYRQVKGPFAEWVHTHRFIPDGEHAILENEISYRLPHGPLGHVFGAGHVDDRLKAMFAYRHALTASDLRRHGRYRTRPPFRIAITGSRGLIGSELALFLATGGHEVIRLITSRPQREGPDDGTQSILWKPQEPPDPAIFAGCDAIIHLAAENIADERWSDAKRKKILDSRTIPTRLLGEAIAASPPERRPKVFVSASAVGIYGDRGDEVLEEESPPGSGFLAEVCRQWEAATVPIAQAGVRVVNVRIGAALTPRGGALGKQLPAFRAGLGAVLGSGRQWVPWVTVPDVVGAIHHCMQEQSLTGPVNVMAPIGVINREFSKTLGRVLWRPVFISLPRFALRAMFGDIADAVLLSSMRGYPKKLLDSGFEFDHAELERGLRFLLGK